MMIVIGECFFFNIFCLRSRLVVCLFVCVCVCYLINLDVYSV